MTDAGLQAVLHPLYLLQGRVSQYLWGDGECENWQDFSVQAAVAATFWIFVLMAVGMVVGGMN